MLTETINSTFNSTVFDNSPVKFTETALKELKQLIYDKEVPEDFGVRVGVKGGGCSGMSYILGFDGKQDGDEEFFINDLRIFMSKAHGMYLLGMEVDYVNGLNNRGFIFSNPNATSTCGCGSSFAV